MNRFALLALALAGPTLAEPGIYQWKDPQGRTVYSDTAPPGRVRELRKFDQATTFGAAAEIPASSPDDASGASRPRTAAGAADGWRERERGFRLRQQEARDQKEREGREAAARTLGQESCERTHRHLQTLESGERLAFVDDRGERYFMDDAEREREISRARQSLRSHCD